MFQKKSCVSILSSIFLICCVSFSFAQNVKYSASDNLTSVLVYKIQLTNVALTDRQIISELNQIAGSQVEFSCRPLNKHVEYVQIRSANNLTLLRNLISEKLNALQVSYKEMEIAQRI